MKIALLAAKRKQENPTRKARRIRRWLSRIAEISLVFDFCIATLTLIGNNLQDITITINLSLVRSLVNWGLTLIIILSVLLFFLWISYNRMTEKKSGD